MTEPARSPMPSCMQCGGAGVITYDGVPTACPCDSGKKWQNDQYLKGVMSGTAFPAPRDLPPGGDVLLRESARRAAGLPVGSIDGPPVRATLLDDPRLREAASVIVGLLEDAPDAPVRARSFLDRLPSELLPTRDRETSGAAPLAPPDDAAPTTARRRGGRPVIRGGA